MAFSVTSQKSVARSLSGARRQSRRVVVVKAALTLSPPPFELNALEPDMSQKTLEFHWGKHHRA